MTQDEAETTLTDCLNKLKAGGWQVVDSATIENDNDEDALQVSMHLHDDLYLRPE